MNNQKYLLDGRKVALIGKLNNEEWIVQEVFVTESGDEIPSGERFTAKSLHDSPVESFKDREIKKKQDQIKKLERDYELIQANLKSARIDKQTSDDIAKLVKSVAVGISESDLSGLHGFLTGQVKWVVIEKYGFELPVLFEEAMKVIDSWGGDKRYEGIKLITLYGKTNGNLSFRIGQYGDGSGSCYDIAPFQTFKDASRYCIDVAMLRMDQGKFYESDVKKLLSSDSAEHLTASERTALLNILKLSISKISERKESEVRALIKRHDDTAATVKTLLAALEQEQAK